LGSKFPQFFRNLQLKVTLPPVRLLITQNNTKILENCPAFESFATDPLVYRIYLFRKIHIAESYILNLIILIVFHRFLLRNQKFVPAPMAFTNVKTGCTFQVCIILRARSGRTSTLQLHFSLSNERQTHVSTPVCVWSPYPDEDSAKVESIQRRFIERLRALSDVIDRNLEVSSCTDAIKISSII